MRFVRLLLRFYRVPVLGRIARQILFLHGADIPLTVEVGSDFILNHRGIGTVMHPKTIIGDRVEIFHGVTLGVAQVRLKNNCAGIWIEDDVLIGAGAKILAPPEGIRVRRGTIVGANAVLMSSTGQDEVWIGVPARMHHRLER